MQHVKYENVYTDHPGASSGILGDGNCVYKTFGDKIRMVRGFLAQCFGIRPKYSVEYLSNRQIPFYHATAATQSQMHILAFPGVFLLINRLLIIFHYVVK